MFDLSEENVSRLLIRDAQQLADRAKEIGATAYAQRPIHRIRPNGQFLQATLRNVESGLSVSAQGNRRVEENAMWRQRRAQLTGLQDVHDQTNATVEDSRCLHGNVERQDDEAVMALLSSKPKRGRGGIGSRVEETGPYLAESLSDWIRQASHLAEDVNPRNRHNVAATGPEARHSTSLATKTKGVSKERKDKWRKKGKKKKKKHKHKTPE